MGTQHGSTGDRPATSEQRTATVALLGASLVAALGFWAGLHMAGPLQATFPVGRAQTRVSAEAEAEPPESAPPLRHDAGANADAWAQVSVLTGTVVDGNGIPVPGATVDVIGDPLDVSLRVVGLTRAAAIAHAPQGWRTAPSTHDDSLGVTVGSVPAIPQAIPMRASILLDTHSKGIVSDTFGNFAIQDVLPGTVRVRASAAGWSGGRTEPFLVRPSSSRAGVRVILARGATVTGRVLGPDGVPLALTPLHLECPGYVHTLSGTTDTEGGFELIGATGSCLLVVRSERLPAVHRRVEVVDGQAVAVELRVSAEFTTARGIVTDERDRAVSGATVELSPVDPGFGEPRAAVSDARGRFEVPGLASQPHRVTVDHPDFTPLELANVVALDPLTLTVARGLSITGTVVFRDAANPIAGARVTLGTLAGITRTTRTDRVGNFDFRRIAIGNYKIFLTHEESLDSSLTVTASSADLERGILALGTIELVRAGVVSGTVLDRLGAPVPLARVTAGSARAITDGTGGFRLTGLAKGEVSVSASHPVAGPAKQHTVARVYEGQETPGLRVHLTGRYDLGLGPSAPQATDTAADSPPATQARIGTNSGIAVELGSRGGAVVVLRVQAGSTADSAGLRVGDIIHTVDGETVSVAAQARSLVRGPPGTIVALEFTRGRRTQRVMIRRERYVASTP